MAVLIPPARPSLGTRLGRFIRNFWYLIVLAGLVLLIVVILIINAVSGANEQQAQEQAQHGATLTAGLARIQTNQASVSLRPTNELTPTTALQTVAGESAVPSTPTLVPTIAPTTQVVSSHSDPVLIALSRIGFSSREEFIRYFQMDVQPFEIATCPEEDNCVRVLREKDSANRILPFHMTNPTSVTFDGWRTGSQPKVPPGSWEVEGVTIRNFGK
ncbi:hypothetical protein HGA88_02265 [Candidatus Roizmanbacteria bacterium]|nr:hypothetical protein [Candidatus Roizmanbacteria bacterium]